MTLKEAHTRSLIFGYCGIRPHQKKEFKKITSNRCAIRNAGRWKKKYTPDVSYSFFILNKLAKDMPDLLSRFNEPLLVRIIRCVSKRWIAVVTGRARAVIFYFFLVWNLIELTIINRGMCCAHCVCIFISFFKKRSRWPAVSLFSFLNVLALFGFSISDCESKCISNQVRPILMVWKM